MSARDAMLKILAKNKTSDQTLIQDVSKNSQRNLVQATGSMVHAQMTSNADLQKMVVQENEADRRTLQVKFSGQFDTRVTNLRILANVVLESQIDAVKRKNEADLEHVATTGTIKTTTVYMPKPRVIKAATK
jgi:hypothetical protein